MNGVNGGCQYIIGPEKYLEIKKQLRGLPKRELILGVQSVMLVQYRR